MRIKNDLHISGITLSLALKQRLGATRKWPVVCARSQGLFLLVLTQQERP